MMTGFEDISPVMKNGLTSTEANFKSLGGNSLLQHNVNIYMLCTYVYSKGVINNQVAKNAFTNIF